MGGIIHELVKDVPLPRMVRVRQTFDAAQIDDVHEAVWKELSQEKIRSTIQPGMRICITAGSRGIDRLREFEKAIADFVKSCGAEPFIIPAMGSHGGCTAEGQLEILTGYGVTEEYCGCPIISDMATTTICHTPDGHPVKIDRHAAEADGIIVFNRVKPHTHFRGKYESGIMKMMTIGLGKQAGAESAHDTGILHLAEVVETFGNAVRTHAKVLFGVASVENAYDKCCRVAAMTNEEIPIVEEALQAYAKTRMPCILLPESDLLLVDQIGKNFSGPGADPNVTGTFSNTWTQGGHKKQRMVFFDLSAESHGNASGLGLADFTTRRWRKWTRSRATPTASPPSALKREKSPLSARARRTPSRRASGPARISTAAKSALSASTTRCIWTRYIFPNPCWRRQRNAPRLRFSRPRSPSRSMRRETCLPERDAHYHIEERRKNYEEKVESAFGPGVLPDAAGRLRRRKHACGRRGRRQRRALRRRRIYGRAQRRR